MNCTTAQSYQLGQSLVEYWGRDPMELKGQRIFFRLCLQRMITFSTTKEFKKPFFLTYKILRLSKPSKPLGSNSGNALPERALQMKFTISKMGILKAK